MNHIWVVLEQRLPMKSMLKNYNFIWSCDNFYVSTHLNRFQFLSNSNNFFTMVIMDLAVEAKPRMTHDDESMTIDCLNISILVNIYR